MNAHAMIVGGDEELVGRIGRLAGTREHLALVHEVEFDAAFAELVAGVAAVCMVVHELEGFRGVEFVRCATAFGCEVPVILLRHGGDADVDRAALEAGAVESVCCGDLTALLLDRVLAYRPGSAGNGVRRAAPLGEPATPHDQLGIDLAKQPALASMSHDLRNPLNTMLGWAQLLRDGRLDEATRARAVEAILRSGRAQASLIEALLDVPKPVVKSGS